MIRSLALTAAAVAAVATMVFAPSASAAPGCESVPWGFLGSQLRTLCDGPMMADGYDVIGDIHGCADDLEALLAQMDYHRSGGVYRHPSRTAIFGTARMVLGNHEFNSLAYATEWPLGSGKYLQPHDDPDHPWSAENEKQHAEFLRQVTGEARISVDNYVQVAPTRPWLSDLVTGRA